MTAAVEWVTIQRAEFDRLSVQAGDADMLRDALDMVVEERDMWRWRVLGGDRPKCRHPRLHDTTDIPTRD